MLKKLIISFYSSSHFFIHHYVLAENHNFEKWLNEFKQRLSTYGVSKNVVEEVLSDAKFLPKVIEYDRYQPEFYEDTFTYIKKDLVKKSKKRYCFIQKGKKNHRYDRERIFS